MCAENCKCSETDCQQSLDTFILPNGLTVGTCRNPACRLAGVTLTLAELAALTEDQRQAWEEVNKVHRREKEADERQRRERLAKYPPHLRGPIG